MTHGHQTRDPGPNTKAREASSGSRIPRPGSHYDVIVVGAGAMGSAAVMHLAARGPRVIAFDRFSVPNDQGSSHGLTRIIRIAYYEHPSYVPLLVRAAELWTDL